MLGRRKLSATLVACAVALVPAAGASAASWTQYRGGPTHVGVNALETMLGVDSARGLHPACAGSNWPGTAAYSSPAIWHHEVLIGDINSRIVAFDEATCALRWAAPTGSVVYSSPAIADGRAIVGTLQTGVYAVDAATGAPSWHADLPGTFFESPTVAGRTAYLTTSQGSVYALDIATGAVRWSRSFAPSAGPGTPTVAHGRVFVMYASGQLRALRASDGKSLYTHGKLGMGDGAPAVSDGALYVGGGGKLYAFDAGTGQLRWSAPAGPDLVSSPAVANGLVWVRTRDRTLRAYDAGTGAPRITATMGGDASEASNYASASPVIANGVVYVTSSDKRLYAFDASDGSALASVDTTGEVWGPPAVANGRVWVGSIDTRCLVCSFAGTP